MKAPTKVVCPRCEGTGARRGRFCGTCRGKGWLWLRDVTAKAFLEAKGR